MMGGGGGDETRAGDTHDLHVQRRLPLADERPGKLMCCRGRGPRPGGLDHTYRDGLQGVIVPELQGHRLQPA